MRDKAIKTKIFSILAILIVLLVVEGIVKAYYIGVVDISNVVNGSDSVYIDVSHMGRGGNKQVAQEMARYILKDLSLSKKSDQNLGSAFCFRDFE